MTKPTAAAHPSTEAASHKAQHVSVTLTDRDYERAAAAAAATHESVAEWISSLVNTALQP